jgi:hypothetical protein
MARHNDDVSNETMNKRRRGFQLRDPCQARPTDRAWRQGADREARSQRSLPLRLAASVSRRAALPPAGFMERDDYRR